MTAITKEQLNGVIGQVSATLVTVNKMRDALDSKLATRFSAFNVIGGLNEIEMSKILAHLLNPSESHAQGDKYLKLFLKLLFSQYDALPNKTRMHSICELNRDIETNNGLLYDAKIKTEDSTDANRRIDITIRAGNFTIGIENKLWAAEQGNQLKDYLEHLWSQSIDKQHAVLVFLCVDKNRQPGSIANPDKHKCSGNLICINYDDIIDWLGDCIQITDSEKIRWYLEEIKTWINKYCYRRGDFMSDSEILADMALGNKNALQAMMYIQDNLDRVKDKLINEYLDYIRESLISRLGEVSKWQIGQAEGNGKHAWYSPIVIKRQDWQGVHATMTFSGAGYNNLSYVIKASKNTCAFHDNLKMELHKRYPLGESSDTTPLYIWFENGSIWTSSDFVQRLYEFHSTPKSELKEKADEMVNNLIEMMKVVDSVLDRQSPTLKS